MEAPIIYIGSFGVTLLLIGMIYTFSCKRPDVTFSKMYCAGSSIHRDLAAYVEDRYIWRIKAIITTAIFIIILWVLIVLWQST
jgi:hypothetical protein